MFNNQLLKTFLYCTLAKTLIVGQKIRRIINKYLKNKMLKEQMLDLAKKA